jgi:hypothetical protein
MSHGLPGFHNGSGNLVSDDDDFGDVARAETVGPEVAPTDRTRTDLQKKLVLRGHRKGAFFHAQIVRAIEDGSSHQGGSKSAELGYCTDITGLDQFTDFLCSKTLG